MESDEQLKGFAGCLGVVTFIAIICTIWKEWEIADSPIIGILPLWGIWLFSLVFDYILPKLLSQVTNKWIIRGSLFAGLLFCLFVCYTCQKGITDNRTVYFNEFGDYFHYEKDCDDINQELTVCQSRRIEAERNGLKPCYCCDEDDD